MPKKKFKVIKNTTQPEFKGVKHDGKDMKFRRDGTFVVSDTGLAAEIDKVHGRRGNQSVAVVPYTDKETNEPGHRYFFGSTPAYSEGWERIFGE